MTAIVRKPGDGENIEVAGSSIAILLAEEDGTPFSFCDTVLAPGFPGPPPHIHRQMHDVFYVLEGTLTLQLDAETVQAPPGTFACITPGTVHTFSNPTDEKVRILNFNMPAGFEGYLRNLAAAMDEHGGMPPPEKVAEIAADYDFELAAPPSGD